MPKYTVQDQQSGKTITFDWNDPNPPTDADMEQVFAEARNISPAPYKEYIRQAEQQNIEESKKLVPRPRDILEYGGWGLGAAIGGPPGAGAGYATGRRIADIIEGKPKPLGEATKATAQDFLTGAVGEGVAPWISKGVEAIGRGVSKLAPRIYESVLKAPPGSVSLEQRNAAVRTALEGKYAPTETGLKKLQSDIDVLNKQIQESVDSMVQKKVTTTTRPGAPAPFEPVIEQNPQGAGFLIKTGPNKYLMSHGYPDIIMDRTRAERTLESLIQSKEYQAQILATQPKTITTETGTIDMNDVVSRIDQLKSFYRRLPDAVAEDYIGPLNELQKKYASKGAITPQEAQAMKQTIYALNRKHYGELKGTIIEGNKAVARGLKEELVKQYPELATLNAQDSALINLENVLERAVKRTRNWDIIGLTDLIGGAAGGVVGAREGNLKRGGEGAAMGMIFMRALRDPAVASRLAFAVSKAKTLQGISFARPLSYEIFNPEPQ